MFPPIYGELLGYFVWIIGVGGVLVIIGFIYLCEKEGLTLGKRKP